MVHSPGFPSSAGPWPARAVVFVLLLGAADGFPGSAGSADPSPKTPAADRKPAGARKLPVAELKTAIDADYPYLDALYKQLHAHPELSRQEEQTAARMVKELRTAGFEVTAGIGGHGLAGVLKNGPGPLVLVRTDLGALPVVERTGLPYASAVRARDPQGKEVGVMHACGHDTHMTCWTGAARYLAAHRERWAGTLLFIGQPAEEVGMGARAMLRDKLFERFGKPDFGLALHCDSITAHGTVTYTDGLALANVDTVDITVRGKGGHGAAPHSTVDPVVIAARLILDLQTLVSRETNPTDPAVVTVGSIHGGTKHNIIPNEVQLQLTVRSTKDSVRTRLLDGIKRMAKAAAMAADAPDPVVSVDTEEFTPAVLNDSTLTRRTVTLFREILGDTNVRERPPIMGGEDFAVYGRAGVPIFMFFVGSQPPEKVAEAQKPGGAPLPAIHSDRFAPVPEPTIKTGVLTLTAAVLNLTGS